MCGWKMVVMPRKTPVFVTSFNQLTWLKPMVEDLLESGVTEPIVVDNASTYEPLLEWLESRPCRVLFRSKNTGPRAAWETLECLDLMKAGPFVVTDSDLDLSGIDFSAALADMQAALDRWPEIVKAGLSIRIDDLPETKLAEAAIGVEREYWRKPTKDPDGFRAPVDTTFAMYRKGAGWAGYDPAWRTVHSCRHMPWYLTEQTDEVRGMLGKMDLGHTMWSSWMASTWGTVNTNSRPVEATIPPQWQIPGKILIECVVTDGGEPVVCVHMACESLCEARVSNLAIVGKDGYVQRFTFNDDSWVDGVATSVLQTKKAYGQHAVEFSDGIHRPTRIALPI